MMRCAGLTLNQNDYIHPNAEGVEVIVENILPYITDFLAN